MDALDRLIRDLSHQIDLDEEAQDPDGTLAGLYVALREAKKAASRGAAAPGAVTLTIWGSRQPWPVLSGSYEGREGVAEGFSAVALTVADLWTAGEPSIRIVINREGESS